MVLADFTFGQALLTVLEVFLFAAWLMVLFVIIGDLFRDHEMSGWGKDALPGHLDSVGVTQLVWSETPPYAGLGRGASKGDSHLRV